MTANPDFSLPDKFSRCIDFSDPTNPFIKTQVTIVPEGSGATTTEVHIYSSIEGTFNGLIKSLRIKNNNATTAYFLQLRLGNATGNFVDIITAPPSLEIYLDSYWQESKINALVWWGVSTTEPDFTPAPDDDITITWRYVAN